MKKKLIIFGGLILPIVAYGAGPTENRKFADVVYAAIGLINSVIPVLAGIALLVFFRGLAKFIYNAGDTSAHEEGRDLMIWGIAALFIMLSYMGIIQFFYGGFGFTRSFGIPLLPTS